MSMPYKILLFWLSVCQKLSKLVEIWQSSGKTIWTIFGTPWDECFSLDCDWRL